jgi:FAD-dependent urate hydroxylase
MWPNGGRALNAIDLGTAVERVSPELTAVDLRGTDGELLSRVDMEALVRKVDQRPYPLARVDLLAVLLDAFGDEHVHLGAECVDVSQSAAGVTATFADGRRAEGELVVGADGLRSAVRRHVVGHDGHFNFLSAAWEGLVPSQPPISDPNTFTFWIGPDRREALMPVANDRMYAFFDFPPDESHGLEGGDVRDRLARDYRGWCEPVQEAIARLDPATTLPVRYFDLEPLHTFVNGRVVLLGDAAHATTPTLGQGAAQASEDALVLAACLSEEASLSEAVQRYDRERRARTQQIVLAARAQTKRIIGDDPAATAAWHEELRNGSRDFVAAVEQITLEGPIQ